MGKRPFPFSTPEVNSIMGNISYLINPGFDYSQSLIANGYLQPNSLHHRSPHRSQQANIHERSVLFTQETHKIRNLLAKAKETIMRLKILFCLSIIILTLACNNQPTSANLATDTPITPTAPPTATITETPYQVFMPTIVAPDNTFYVAPNGSNSSGSGRANAPWRTIAYAVSQVPDTSIILAMPGTYSGETELSRKFASGITIRSQTPYQAKLRHNDKVLFCFVCAGITIEGFDIAHSGPGAGRYVIQIQDTADNGTGGRDLRFINNIFHDSYNNDIIKVNNGARNILFEDNIFYNQQGQDSHIDINSALNITLKHNIFFNDFAGNGRSDTNTGSFIVIKDSNGNEDNILGSENITLDGNIFANWIGGSGNSFIALGDDSAVNYYFASDVLIQNNLFIGNANDPIHSTLKIVGAEDVTFRNNTITGNLPGKSFAFRLTGQSSLPNRNITFYNNIWTDPTGTMGAEDNQDYNNFADSEATASYVINNNLYWNGGQPIPPDDDEIISYLDDADATLTNPKLPTDQSTFQPPRWLPATGQFANGATSIQQLFAQLVDDYGTIPANSVAIDAANAETAPATDILDTPRNNPDLGAYERP
jgi:hypothetical protein